MRETLTMWAAAVTDPAPVDESLDLLDLGGRAGVRMRALSGGEQRRVDLARTLTGRPEVLLLDEPTTGLDPESRHRVWELIWSLREDGVAVLVTTHYLEETEALADRISIMRAGRIVLSGTHEELVADQPCVVGRTSRDSAEVAVLEPVGVAVEGEDFGVVNGPVDSGGGGDVVPEGRTRRPHHSFRRACSR